MGLPPIDISNNILYVINQHHTRCMALSVAVMVGEARNWIPELVERARKLNVTAGDQPGADLGPVISPQSKARIERYVI